MFSVLIKIDNTYKPSTGANQKALQTTSDKTLIRHEKKPNLYIRKGKTHFSADFFTPAPTKNASVFDRARLCR